MNTNHRILWSNIENCLDSRHKRWRERIEKSGQVRAVKDRSQGRTWSDDKVFEAVLLAVLSSNTVWSKVEQVQDDLSALFCGFSLESYASLSDAEIDKRFVPWFIERRAGSMTLRRNLKHLIRAARKLSQYSKRNGGADQYFTSLLAQCDGDPKQVALLLGDQGEHKLPSFGIPIAAEALKNLGFDVAQPERHLTRALGSFGLVRFNRWERTPGGRESPGSTSQEKLEVMTVAEEIAAAADQSVVFVDNAIWLLCARDEGWYLTNSELEEIASNSRRSRTRIEAPQ